MPCRNTIYHKFQAVLASKPSIQYPQAMKNILNPELQTPPSVVLLHCGCLSLIPFNPFIEFMNLEFGTTHQVQMC